MTLVAPPEQDSAPFSIGRVATMAEQGASRLGQVLAAAPELRTRPNLALAAMNAAGDVRAAAQTVAHASNLMAVAQAFSDVASQSGGAKALHEQIASQSSRYANVLSALLSRPLGYGLPDDEQSGSAALSGVMGNVLGAGGTPARPGTQVTPQTQAQIQAQFPPPGPGLLGEVGHVLATPYRVWHQAAQRELDAQGGVKAPIIAAGQIPPSFAAQVKAFGPRKALANAAAAINAPLTEIQHQYRYLHDVEANHGPLAAAEASLGLLAGGALGYLGGGARGAILGGEAATEFTGHILYPNSWQRAASPNYTDPNTHRPVSIGRDFASAVGLQPGSAPFTVVSGLSDAIGDMTLDPVANVGGLVSEARGLQGAKGLLGSRFSGTAVTADSIDTVYDQYPAVRRAFDAIAHSSPGEIAIHNPALNVAAPATDGVRHISGFVQALGNASTGEQVKEVMKDALRAGDLTGGFKAPSLTLTRKALQGAAKGLQDWSAVPARAGDEPADFLAAATQQRSRLLARVVDATFRSQTRVAEDWDPELLRYDSQSLDLMGPTAPKALYQILRQGEDDKTAMATVERFTSTNDVGQRLGIWHNALSDLLLARAARSATMRGSTLTGVGSEAAFADPEILRNVQQVAASLSSEGLAGGVYGASDKGDLLEPLVDSTDPDRTYDAGLLQNHTGRVSVPTFAQVRRGGQMLAGGHMLFGKADDFLYDAVTTRFFKRSVLLSLSFAEHIVAGEMLQSALRVGPFNMARSIVTDIASRLGYQLEADPDEAGIIAQVASAVLRKTDPERFATASALLMRHDGHFAFGTGVGAGHNIADEVKSRESWAQMFAALRSRAPRTVTTGRYGLQGYDPGGAQDAAWASWLAEGARDPATQAAAGAYRDALSAGRTPADATTLAAAAAKDTLDALPEEQAALFARHTDRTQTGADLGLSPHEDWARNIVANLKGMTTGMDGNLHDDLLAKIADGEASFDPQALEHLPPNQHPPLVKGQATKPYISGRIGQASTWVHRKMLSPIINGFSRDPTYIEEVHRQMQALRPLMDQGMQLDEAMNVAEERAVQHMIRFVHNIGERTQFSELARNAAPFFFAQQQAYKRLGRLLAENPGAFRQYQMGLQAMANIASQHKDANGASVIAFPGAGSMTTGMLKGFSALGWAPTGSVPIVWNGSLSSTNIIAPFAEGISGLRPDLGPVVQIPLAGLKGIFSELGMQPEVNAVNAALGPIAAGEATPSKAWSMLVPNTFVQRIMEGLDPTLLNTYYASSAHQMIAMLDYEQNLAMERWVKGGQKGPKPNLIPDPAIERSGGLNSDQMAFLDRVRNGTRVLAFTKALLGFATPLSPTLSFDKWGLSAELKNDISKSGLSQGLTGFLMKHPDATPFTVWSSDTAAGGAELPATAKSMDWISQNQDFVKAHPDAALYFLPPADSKDAFSQQAYNQELSSHLRTRKTDPGFLQSVYVAEGDHLYFDVLQPIYNTFRAMGGHPGWTQDQAKAWAADPKNASALLAIKPSSGLTTWWNQTLATVEAQNPTWAANFTGPTRQVAAREAYDGIVKALADPHLPPSPQTPAIRDLVSAYKQVGSALPVGDSAYASAQQSAVQKGWREWLDSVKTERPDLSNVITAVFYNLGAPANGG